jgi:hypothetical protein
MISHLPSMGEGIQNGVGRPLESRTYIPVIGWDAYLQESFIVCLYIKLRYSLLHMKKTVGQT